MGMPLFERHSRGLVPTEFGDTLVIHARAVLAEVDRASVALKLMAEGAGGYLAIGATASASTSLLPDTLARFRQHFPDVQLSIMENILDNLLPLLHEGRLDFVLTRIEDEAFDERLICEPLYGEQICVVAGRTHPLVQQTELSWADTCAFPWITPPKGNPLRRELDYEFALAGEARPCYRIEAVGILMIVGLLQQGELLSAVSRRVLAYFEPLGQLVALDLPYRRQGNVGVLRQRNAQHTPQRAHFMQALREASAAPRGGAAPVVYSNQAQDTNRNVPPGQDQSK